MNALEIRKREAKVFIMQRQAEDIQEEQKSGKENMEEEEGNELNQIKRQIHS
jgi:hypothetical protein